MAMTMQHRHPIADVFHHTQIMRHEKIGQAQLRLQFACVYSLSPAVTDGR